MKDVANENFVVVNVKSFLWKMTAEIEKELTIPLQSTSMSEDELDDYIHEYLSKGDGFKTFYSGENFIDFTWYEEELEISVVKPPFHLRDITSAPP